MNKKSRLTWSPISIPCGEGKAMSARTGMPRCPVVNSAKKMRPYQKMGFEALSRAPRGLLLSPVSSGKTTLAQFIGMDKLARNPLLKMIIAVPQDIIAPGFCSGSLELPDRTMHDWLILNSNNLCNRRQDTCVNVIRRFLGGKGKDISHRIAICTFPAIINVFKDIKKRGDYEHLDNTLLVVDEAHHLCMMDDLSNEMGKVTDYFASNEGRGCQVLMMSGSFYRMDGRNVIAKEKEGLFKRHEVPYDVYLSSMRHLESFSLDFIFTDKTYEECVGELLDARPDAKMIVYLPHTASNSTRKEKRHQVRRIKECLGEEIESDGTTVLIRRRDGRIIRAIDLVEDNPAVRKKRKDWLQERKDNELIINSEKDRLDVVISMNMGTEGFDWHWADHAVVLGTRHSVNMLQQIIGRPLRDAEGKRKASLTMVIPSTVDDKDMTDGLNDFCKMIVTVMLLEDMLDPVDIKYRKSTGKGGEGPKSIFELIPENKVDEVVRMGYHLAILAQEQHTGYRGFCKDMSDYLLGLPIEDVDLERVVQKLWAMFCRQYLVEHGTDLSCIDMDLISEADPTLFARSASKAYSAHMGQDTWPAMRRSISRASRYMTLEEAMGHVLDIGVKDENEYEKIARAEFEAGGPFRSRIEVEQALGEGSIKAVEGSVLPVHPQCSYGVSWPGWDNFLGRGPKKPYSLVEKPKRTETLYWVMKEPMWYHAPEQLLLSGSKAELEGRVVLGEYDAIKDKREATSLVEDRKKGMRGLSNCTGPGASPSRKAVCVTGLLQGHSGLFWEMSAQEARRAGLKWRSNTMLTIKGMGSFPVDRKDIMMEEPECPGR